MPRRTQREEKPKALALGFFGVGEITQDDLKSNLDDLAGRDRDVVVYLGISPETEVPTFADVIDWAADAEATVVAFAVEDGLSRNAKSWLEAVDEVKEGGDVVHQVVERLSDRRAVDGKLLIFWDDDAADPDKNVDDAKAYDAVEAAWDAEVAVYNICAALDPILQTSKDDEPEPEPAAAPEPEPERPARRRRASASDEPAAEKAPPARRSRKEAPADEAQTDARPSAKEEALGKLETARKADPKGGQGAITGNGRADMSDGAVEDILDSFAALVARKVLAELRAAQDAGEPAARSRR